MLIVKVPNPKLEGEVEFFDFRVTGIIPGIVLDIRSQFETL